MFTILHAKVDSLNKKYTDSEHIGEVEKVNEENAREKKYMYMINKCEKRWLKTANRKWNIERMAPCRFVQYTMFWKMDLERQNPHK